MIIVKLTKPEFETMFDKMKGCLRVDVSSWNTLGMNDQERKAYIHKQLNPDMPMYIDYWTEDGLVRYTK